MKQEILTKTLKTIRYFGEIIILVDAAIHFYKFVQEDIIPKLKSKKVKRADVPVEHEDKRSE